VPDKTDMYEELRLGPLSRTSPGYCMDAWRFATDEGCDHGRFQRGTWDVLIEPDRHEMSVLDGSECLGDG